MDVSIKIGIWRIILQLDCDGAAVVLVSTDLDNISAVCNRCLVVLRGVYLGQAATVGLTPENLSAAAALHPASNGFGEV